MTGGEAVRLLDLVFVLVAVVIIGVASAVVLRTELRVRRHRKQIGADQAELERLLDEGDRVGAAKVARRIFERRPPNLP